MKKLYAFGALMLCFGVSFGQIHNRRENRQANITIQNEIILVEGGMFVMGSKKGEDNEKPIHWVELSSFKISKYEVTNTQIARFLNEYGSDEIKGTVFQGKRMISEALNGVRKNGNKWKPQVGFENHPAVHVTWYGAYEFCRFYGYRLPTEAEWEYAAKGGKESNSNKYSGSNLLSKVAWYAGNSGFTTHEVGTKQPNELGLYDMVGNIQEWCADWYDATYYKVSAEKNPIGPNNGATKVIRGGSWGNVKRFLSIAGRYRDLPANSNADYGFRYVITD